MVPRIAARTESARMTENIETRRKRLRFRSWHRGTKELDLLIGRFADHALPDMGEAELDRFEALLEVPEPVIYAWLVGQAPPPPDYDHDVTRRLLAFKFTPETS